MDTRLGSLSVHLDTPQCFSAEMYAVDLNLSGASDELKVDMISCDSIIVDKLFDFFFFICLLMLKTKFCLIQ